MSNVMCMQLWSMHNLGKDHIILLSAHNNAKIIKREAITKAISGELVSCEQ
jgi:hypothetical protein